MGRNRSTNRAKNTPGAESTEQSEGLWLTDEQTKRIQEVVKAFPYLEKIYINAKGEYHFTARPGFNEYSVADFGGEVSEEIDATDEGSEDI